MGSVRVLLVKTWGMCIESKIGSNFIGLSFEIATLLGPLKVACLLQAHRGGMTRLM